MQYNTNKKRASVSNRGRSGNRWPTATVGTQLRPLEDAWSRVFRLLLGMQKREKPPPLHSSPHIGTRLSTKIIVLRFDENKNYRGARDRDTFPLADPSTSVSISPGWVYCKSTASGPLTVWYVVFFISFCCLLFSLSSFSCFFSCHRSRKHKRVNQQTMVAASARSTTTTCSHSRRPAGLCWVSAAEFDCAHQQA